tara:strand:+ start:3152 stop:3490 length:339 start_codon:yes stop_codon:yes gene_type:complete
MKKEEIILQKIDDLQTTTIVNNTCVDKRFKRLEETLEETIQRFSEISILKSTLNAVIESQERKQKTISDLETEVIKLEVIKTEFLMLCRDIENKTITRKELIDYVKKQNLEL